MKKTIWQLHIRYLGYRNASYSLLEDTSLNLESNTVYGLMGASGMGKTSLWEGLINYPKRDLRINYSLMKNGNTKPLGNGIALLPQQPAYTINPTIKAGSALKDVMRANENYSKEQLDQILVNASFPAELLNSYPHELSGGEVQRLAFAISLAMKAHWLILDEPTASLDRLTASTILESAVNWTKEEDRLCIISSHDGDLLAKYCDEIILMEEQKLLEPFDAKHGHGQLSIQFPNFHSRKKSKTDLAVPLISVEKGQYHYDKKGSSFSLNVDFNIPKNSIVGICGRSGSGKSTLGRLIAGYLDWEAGNIDVSGQLSSNSNIQYVPQDPVLNFHPLQSIQQQLYPIFKKWHPNSGQAAFEQYIQQLSIQTEWLQHSILELSGGQRQRLLLARALISEPELLVLDETLSALDIPAAIEILEWLHSVQQKVQFSIVLISHDLRLLQSICEEIHIMSDGRLVETIIPAKGKNNFKSGVTKALFHTYN